MPGRLEPIGSTPNIDPRFLNGTCGSTQEDNKGLTRDDHALEAIRLRAVREALANGYGRYRSIALRRLRDPDAADDVVQAFALKALDRAGQLRDPKAVHGWLQRLFDTTLIDFCRRRSTCRHREVAFELEQHDRADATVVDQGPDPVRTVVASLARLKKEYAEVIYRLDLLDEPRQEVANRFGVTVNNLTVRAHRARRALREALEATPISGIPVRDGASPAAILALWNA